MRGMLLFALFALLALSASARHLTQSPAAARPASIATYPEVLSAATRANAPISTFLAAVQAAGLATTLNNGKPYTILAPTNAAFTEALKDLCLTQAALLADKPLLTKILSYHVVSGGALLSTQLRDDQKVNTLLAGPTANQPAQLKVDLDDDGPGVEFDGASNDADVVTADIKAGNVVVHVIDEVLVPPGVKSACKDKDNDK